MPVRNADIAALFEEVADLLDLNDANPFRVRAYRNAARTLNQLSEPVVGRVAAGEDLTELPDIGDDLAEKIEEVVETGTMEQLEELRQEVDPALVKLMSVPGLGANRVRALHDALGVTTLADLETAALEGQIQTVRGFGEKMEQNILRRLKEAGEERRWLRTSVEHIVSSLVEYLSPHDAVEQVDVAGSYRRRKETVGDLDVLVLSTEGAAVMEHVVDYKDADEVLSHGDTRTSILLNSEIQVDVRVVPPESYGAALHYFTGSKAHNVKLRDWAIEEGLKINEYGVFNAFEDEERVAGKTEKELYDLFDLPVIPPELREDRGELEAGREGALPDLITLDDVRGNLHTHTTDSDGRNSLREMAEAAKEWGLEYLAITDHSPNVAVVDSLDADALREQMEAIDRLNETLDDFRLLKSIEVDILKDGSLDLPDEVLSDLDVCVCSLHTDLDLGEEEQTKRVLRAMDNPNFHIWAHPTARRLNERPPVELDLDRLLKAAAKKDCVVELNGQPERLDLSDVYCKQAKELGLKVVLGADAHWTREFDFLRHGIDQARRGWLEPDDVLNTKPWEEIADRFDR